MIQRPLGDDYVLIGEVIGNIWATRKEEALAGLKLMLVRQLDGDMRPYDGRDFVAADVIGAGIGERVIIVQGSTARKALGNDNIPVDAVIIAIIDSLLVEKTPRFEKEG